MNAHVPRGWQPVCIERADGGFEYRMPSGRWLVKRLEAVIAEHDPHVAGDTQTRQIRWCSKCGERPVFIGGLCAECDRVERSAERERSIDIPIPHPTPPLPPMAELVSIYSVAAWKEDFSQGENHASVIQRGLEAALKACGITVEGKR